MNTCPQNLSGAGYQRPYFRTTIWCDIEHTNFDKKLS